MLCRFCISVCAAAVGVWSAGACRTQGRRQLRRHRQRQPVGGVRLARHAPVGLEPRQGRRGTPAARSHWPRHGGQHHR